MTLRFDIQWEAPPRGVKSDELRACWARLEILADGRSLSRVEDGESGTVRRSIYVSTYPLAEWAAFNWWLLVADGRPLPSGGNFDRRGIRSAGDGFCWPDISFQPQGERTLIRSRRRSLDSDLHFLTDADVQVYASDVIEALSSMVEVTIERLREVQVRGTQLESEWEALIALDEEEQEFCEASARLGLDPFSEGADLANDISTAFNGLPGDLANDFFDAASPDAIDADLRWLKAAVSSTSKTRRKTTGNFSLGELRPNVVTERHRRRLQAPWEIGYACARLAREASGLKASDQLVDIPSIVLGADPSQRIVGAGAIRDDNFSVFATPRGGGVERRRFLSARSIWHDLIGKPGGAYMLSNSAATHQQEGRSFAAELLAPAAGIVDIASEVGPDIEAIAEHFRVSTWVVDYQIRNQELPV